MRELTPAAHAAKQIRGILKSTFPNIKFSVKSSNFSMGDSVNVDYEDGPKSTDIKELISQYQYGHFNGMEDIYEHSNTNDDIPQTKFLHVNRNISESTREQIIKKLNIKDVDGWNDKRGLWNTQVIWQEFNTMEFKEATQ